MTEWIRKKTDTAPMRLHKKDGVVYLTFPLLDEMEGCIHGCSTRFGGVSEGYLGRMNLGPGCGDERERVLENHRRFAAAVGYPVERSVLTRQTHSVNIRVATSGDSGKGYSRERDYDSVDGLVTNEPGLPLLTFFADCVPLLFLDPVHRAVGCAHSGWRGTAGNIARAALETMAGQYGTDPADVRMAIGPSICQDCYEVSEDVIDRFREAFAPELWTKLFYQKGIKYQLNLQEACRQNALAAGVQYEHIAMPDLCTCCNPTGLFSHRASAGKRGNLSAVIMIV